MQHIHFSRMFGLAVLVAGFLSSALLPVQAQGLDPNIRTVQNAQRITVNLHSVLPERIMMVVKKIAERELPRRAPEQPIWILDTSSGLLLYYEGEESFAMKPVSQLVDDNGVRFGQKALELGKASKSGWLSVTLSGKTYKAYCHSFWPTVVCSLAT